MQGNASDLMASPSVNALELLQALNRLDARPRLLLHRDGTLIWASHEANGELQSRVDLRLDAGRVTSTHIRHNPKIQRLLAVPDGQNQSASFKGAGGRDPLIIHATSVDRRCVCWVLSRPRIVQSQRLPDMQGCFGLTPSEFDIVRDLFAGRTAQQIAGCNRVSVHTVRAHIKNIYRKLAIGCREELWAKISSYVP